MFIVNIPILKWWNVVAFHSLMGCPSVCEKHIQSPHQFAYFLPGSSHSTRMRVPPHPSLQTWGHAPTKTLQRRIKARQVMKKKVCYWGVVLATFNNIIFHKPKLAAETETWQQRPSLKYWKGHIRKESSDVVDEATLQSSEAHKQSNYIWKPWYDLALLNVRFSF